MKKPLSRSRKIKYVMTGLVVTCLLLLAGSVILNRYLSRPVEIRDIDIDTDARLLIVPFNQISKKNGITQFKLKASSARLMNEQARAEMTDVFIEYFTEQGKPVSVTSRQGILDTRTMDGVFTGQVTVRYDSMSLETKTLHYRKKEHIIYSNDHVVVRNQGSFIEADSMEIDLNAGTTVFEGGVKGKFSDTRNML